MNVDRKDGREGWVSAIFEYPTPERVDEKLSQIVQYQKPPAFVVHLTNSDDVLSMDRVRDAKPEGQPLMAIVDMENIENVAIEDVMKADKVVIVAKGENNAEDLHRLMRRQPGFLPSVLWNHRDITLLCDLQALDLRAAREKLAAVRNRLVV